MFKPSYIWQVFSAEGRLINPEPVGEDWNSEEINTSNAFKSKEEAVERLNALAERHKNMKYESYVCVEIYNFEDAED